MLGLLGILELIVVALNFNFLFTFQLVEFKPLPGAAAFQLSNPPLLQMVSLLGSLNVSSILSRFAQPNAKKFCYK